MDAVKTQLSKLSAWRRGGSIALIGVGALVVGGQLARGMRHTTHVAFSVPAAWVGVPSEAEVSYLIDGEMVRTVRMHFAAGVPSLLQHSAELARGTYRTLVRFRSERGEQASFSGRLVVPVDARVRVNLYPE